MTMETEISDAATGKEMAAVAGSHQELGESYGTDSLPDPPEGTSFTDGHLSFTLLAPCTVREYKFPLIPITSFVVLCYVSPRKQIH